MKKVLGFQIFLIALLLLSTSTVSICQYQVILSTDNVNDAGTDDRVSIRLVGQNGQSEWLQCDKPGYDDFEKGKTDTYLFNTIPLELTKIRLRLTGTDGWRFKKAKVLYNGEEYLTGIENEWLDNDSGNDSDTKTYTLIKSTTAISTYQVSLNTIDASDGGTDDRIDVNLVGNNRSTGFMQCDRVDNDDFKRGTKNTFHLNNSTHVEYIRSIKIKKYASDGWRFGGATIIHNGYKYTTGSKNVWLDNGETKSFSLTRQPLSELLTIPGTNSYFSQEELIAGLNNEGLELVQNTVQQGLEQGAAKLRINQCALVYGEYDENANEANFGLLMCATKLGDNVTLETTAIYGGCESSEGPLSGAKCEIGVGAAALKVKFSGGEANFEIKGPSANSCGALTSDLMCFEAGASLASTSFEITDESGNGIGCSLDAGIGAGAGGSYEDGVVTVGVDFKLGVGGSIEFSVNAEDAAEKVYSVGKTGYTYTKNGIVTASPAIADFFEDDLPNGIQKGYSTTLHLGENGGNYIIKNVSSNPVTNGINNFGKSIGLW